VIYSILSSPSLSFQSHPPYSPQRRGGGKKFGYAGWRWMCWMDVKELERIWSDVWDEDGAKKDGKDGSADGWNGCCGRKNGARKKRASWRLLKEQINPRGLVRYENHIFRVVQRFGQLYITPRYRYVRITERGRRIVQEAQEIPVMCYEEFFDKYLSHMQTWNTPDINGVRVSGIQQKFLKSIAEEGVLPCTGDLRRC